VHSPKSKTRPSKTPKTAPQPVAEWAFAAIGTEWWIGIYQPIPAGQLAALKQQVAERIEQFDQAFSRFRADSWVSQVAQSAGTYSIPDDGMALFTLYRRLYDTTGGRVTPLIGQTLSDAGYDALYSLQPGTPQPAPKWNQAMQVTQTTLTTNQPMLLDFGAVGKGYLVDLLATLLHDAEVRAYCIDASGDMYCTGLDSPLAIGLEHPATPDTIIGVARLSQGALCGSATNRRAWGTYHHIIDPHTAQPVQHIQAVWVCAENTALADGLATALFFTPPEHLRKHFSFAHCMVYRDNTVQCSADFPAELFR
jgi:thiamine biosynthesis lipoprotein